MPSKPILPVSLVMTVRNEAQSLPRLLETLQAQSALPSEVVIVDGGSSDGTQSIARSYEDRLPVRVIDATGANISQGRNIGIVQARCETVAVTDAGVRLDPRWLESLVQPLLDGRADVSSGFFLPDPHTAFEAAMGATVLPTLADVEPSTFLPSSRSVAFRRYAWERAGGYPEWLDYSEDLVFDMNLKSAGFRFAFVPEALVYFRPRPNLKAFYLQYYRYARGDGKADLWRKRHATRYFTYTVGPFFAAICLRNRRQPWAKAGLLATAASATVYCRRPFQRLSDLSGSLSTAEKMYAIALIPLIRLTGDVAKILGYPVGVLWRLRHRRSTAR